MSIGIKLEPDVKGYKIIPMKCPNCENANFLFRLSNEEIHDVIGDADNYPEEKKVKCKVCESTFKYEVFKRGLPRIGWEK